MTSPIDVCNAAIDLLDAISERVVANEYCAVTKHPNVADRTVLDFDTASIYNERVALRRVVADYLRDRP